jgi:hypothetical protein
VEEWLSALPVGGFSAGAILAVVVLMLFRGQLVTKREHEETRADRDTWRAAWDTSEAQTTDKVIRALPRMPEGQTP